MALCCSRKASIETVFSLENYGLSIDVKPVLWEVSLLLCILEITDLLAAFTTLPLHDPSRHETTDGLDNPSCTNGDRSSFAAAAVDCFQHTCGMAEDLETAAADLICDLLHLLHANNQNPLPTLRNGIQAFLCEASKIQSSE